MKVKKTILLSLFFLFFFPFLAFSEEPIKTKVEEKEKPATIKILLEKDSEGLLLEAHGPYAVYNPENGKKMSSGRRGKRFYLYPHAEGIKWGENFLGTFQLQIVPTSSETTFLVNGIQYHGAIEIYHIENRLSIINEVNVESYIKATLAEQFLPPIPPSVLDALAIISRTNTYYTALTNRDAFWHVKAKEVGYHGAALTLQNLEIDRAVDRSRHLIMTFEKHPFPCSWTENSGGKTASYTAIFRKNASTPMGVELPYARRTREDFRWSLTVNTQELAKMVKTNRVTGMDLFIDHFSGRVYAARLHDGSHTEDIDFTALQKTLGADQLKSNDFTVSIKGNIAVFEGYGKGPGVGLCLYSAKQMAERGDQAPQILMKFFPEASVEKMNSLPKGTLGERSAISFKKNKPSKHKHKLLHR